jgi:hypothetical protein
MTRLQVNLEPFVTENLSEHSGDKPRGLSLKTTNNMA